MAKLFAMPRRETPDAEERERALDAERSWIVEAPAGSGKTALLIQRYLRLLAHESVSEPEQVLAITFTRAATEEIRERVLRELRQAEEGAPTSNEYEYRTRAMAEAVLERDRRLGWALLDESRRLRVRTIDAVCAEIARALPVLTGGGGALRPIEIAAGLYREAARRTWMRLGGEDAALDAALRLLLLHRDGDLRTCELLVAEMLAEREQWGSLIPLGEADMSEERMESQVRARLDASLERVVCEGLSRLARVFPEGVLGALTRLAAEIGHAPPYNPDYHPFAICRGLHEAPGEAAAHLEHWRALASLLLTKENGWRSSLAKNALGVLLSDPQKKTFKLLLDGLRDNEELREVLQELSALPPAEYPAEQWAVAQALFRVLRQALAELQVVFSERGECDFAEPALLARYALNRQGGAESLESALGVELKHLLVDEMQDTSTRQYELIERLTEGWASEGKTVFLVGDPKQSIYLFRQARVERFIETMSSERLGSLPVGLLRLTANFRSQAGLVEGFNEDFAAVFGQHTEPQETGGVNYLPVEASRPAAADRAGNGGAAWHLTIAGKNGDDLRSVARAQTSKDARDLRRVVEQWRARPLPQGRSEAWKIAVLVQSRKSLAKVLPELRRAPTLPFRAVKIDALHERREVLDLLALTRALLHPADRTAWLAVLHAPWCGLGLADLHILTGADDPAFTGRPMMDLLALHGSEISGNGMERLERVWPVLSAAVDTRGRVRLPELIERTWRSLRGETYLDANSLENALAFLTLLQTMDRDAGEIALPELMRRLRMLYAAADDAGDAVELMTIHGAKGLEWDVVLVPELGRRAPAARARLLDWEELPEGGVVLAPIAGKGQESLALNRWLRGLRAKREAAERKRLFYVACTRAREELHLFGTANARSDGDVSADAGSLLEAAWPAAERRLEEARRSGGTAAGEPVAMVLDLAAAGEESEAETIGKERPAMLERLPLSQMARPRSSGAERATMAEGERALETARFVRPEGSFARRALGTAVHAFLEEAAARLAQGNDAFQLRAELSKWEPRIHAVLRAGGLPPRVVAAQAHTVMAALDRTLEDETGRWLLEARSGARSELALTLWEDERRHYRIDRIFFAGASPGEPEDGYLWIVDYKTASDPAAQHDPAQMQRFLEREQRRYAPQLEAYARAIGGPEVRLGLWFPLMQRLCWWVTGETRVSNEQS